MTLFTTQTVSVYSKGNEENFAGSSHENDGDLRHNRQRSPSSSAAAALLRKHVQILAINLDLLVNQSQEKDVGNYSANTHTTNGLKW